MDNPLGVEVKFEWTAEPPDMTTCRACKETIYTTQYRLKITLNNEEIKPDRPTVLCEPCYNLPHD